ncbi:MAG: hypothetical protein CM15mP80_05490 [Alphaproteobacteria bacterium]|nr:MAG: hypothetical protein CM15mP80_05490 [Alphaproteobacteria bacterium]
MWGSNARHPPKFLNFIFFLQNWRNFLGKILGVRSKMGNVRTPKFFGE